MKKILSCALLGAVLAGHASAESSNLNSASPIVYTKYGAVLGARTVRGVEFLGIPYAKAPVGELRWRGPQKPAPWGGVKRAETYAPRCLQSRDLDSLARPQGSEDCLYLNIFAPRDVKKSDKLPVLFWIHGGELVTGSGADFDPSDLAKASNTIVVTFNYRLGVLGFLAADGLARETMRHANYGLMDQIAALDFVRENIRAFGGNPANITIIGPERIRRSSPITMKEALALGNAFAREMGCAASKTMDSLASAKCLRTLPAEKIIAMQKPYVTRRLIIDDDLVPGYSNLN